MGDHVINIEGPPNPIKSITVLVLIFVVSLCLFGFAAIILLPLPGLVLILYKEKWLWGMGILAVLAAFLLGLGVPHAHLSILVLMYALVTILLYRGLLNGWGSQKTILAGTAVAILALIIGLALLILGPRKELGKRPVEGLTSSIDLMIQQYENGLASYKGVRGVDEQAQWIGKNRELITLSLVRIMPGLVICMVFLSLFLNFFIAQFLWEREGGPSLGGPPINEWRIHDLLPWVIVIALGLLFIQTGPFFAIALNLLLIMGVIYFTQGTAVFLFFINKSKIGLTWKVIIIILSYLIIYTYPLFVFMGLLDTWMEFRRVRPQAA